MSPVGGVGINLAKVQRRRERPTRIIQAGQVFIQNAAIEPNLNGDLSPIPIPKIVGRGPLQFIPPIVVGRGFRPQYVRSGRARRVVRHVIKTSVTYQHEPSAGFDTCVLRQVLHRPTNGASANTRVQRLRHRRANHHSVRCVNLAGW
jgi:hypothetical protein